MCVRLDMNIRNFQRIILGAGIYGLYAALQSVKNGYSVCILEADTSAFSRATTINQARIHNGYHYPRSYATAKKSSHYFEKFCRDFSFCIFKDFEQIYATSDKFSWTTRSQFISFCKALNIKCDEINPELYFKKGLCDGAFITQEYTYDAKILKSYFLDELAKYDNAKILYNMKISHIENDGKNYIISVDNEKFSAPFVLNATYASVNQIHNLLNFTPFHIKYELCEIILCETNEKLNNLGLTVMDGPFFSIMPYGKTGLHSLTSVSFTPHETSFSSLPEFKCVKNISETCSKFHLNNCNDCTHRPKSAWPYMEHLAKKYMHDSLKFYYKDSLFTIKPILQASEIDDSRPTIIKTFSTSPTFISVLSGKINTVYDLDEVLNYE